MSSETSFSVISLPTPSATSAAAQPMTVLVVDDDDAVRAVTVEALEDSGLTVLEADSAFAVLDLIATGGATFDLALLDFAMPDMNGRELGKMLCSLRGEDCVLYLTGFGGVPELHDVRPDRILSKPFDFFALAERVRGEIAARRVVC